MSVTVGVQPDALVLEPGSRATVAVGVTNSSDVVEHYEASVLGLPFGVSASSEPPTTKLRPGEQGVITVTVELARRPPPAATSTVLGVLVTSPYRHQVSRCEELRLQVTPISGLTAKARPEVATGARAGYRLEVANPGNAPVLVALLGQDAERAADVQFDPYELYLAPGGTGAAGVTVAARRPWTGSPVRREIVLTARAAEIEATSTVTLVQRPRIPSTVLRVLGVVGGLAVMTGAMFGAARMASTMFNQGALEREGDKARTQATASVQSEHERALASAAQAREARLQAEASQSAALASQLLTASGAERSRLEASQSDLAEKSKAAESADAASSAAIAASAASASQASASTAAAASASAASESASAASASAASAQAAASLAAVPPAIVDLTGPPPGLPATWTGPVAAGAFPPLTITAVPGQVSGQCSAMTTVSRMNQPQLGYFIAPGTIDTATGSGTCLNVPVRIQFATPVRQVTVTLKATGVTPAGALSTAPLNYELQAEGAPAASNQVATAGSLTTLSYTAAPGSPLIGAVRISGQKAGTDTPLLVLQSVSYK